MKKEMDDIDITFRIWNVILACIAVLFVIGDIFLVILLYWYVTQKLFPPTCI